MSKFDVPLFVIASSAREEGKNINIGDYEYFAAMPMDTFHDSLQQGKRTQFGKDPISSFSDLSYVDQLGLIPCIESAKDIKDNTNVAEAYTICFRDKESGEPVPIQIPGYEPKLSYTIRSNPPVKPGQTQTIDIAVTRRIIENGVSKNVTTQVRLVYGCFKGARTPKGTYFLDDQDQKTILDEARIKDNSLFNKLSNQQYQKQ